MKIKINKDNWSGEERELIVEGNTFKVHGYTFHMKEEKLSEGHIMYAVTSPDFGGPVLEGFSFPNIDSGEVTFNCELSGLSRTHPNPYVAAAQLLFNTI